MVLPQGRKEKRTVALSGVHICVLPWSKGYIGSTGFRMEVGRFRKMMVGGLALAQGFPTSLQFAYLFHQMRTTNNQTFQ